MIRALIGRPVRYSSSSDRLILALVLLLSIGSSTRAQTKLGSELANERAEKRGILFDVQLRRSAILLLREVESAYGSAIRQLVSQDLGDTVGARSMVDADGAPVIQINDKLGRKEAVIVHELFHLKRISEGFATVGFFFPSDQNDQATRNLFLIGIEPHLYDQVEHSIFYPDMRRMRIDPAPDVRMLWETQLRAPTIFNSPTTDPVVLPMLYFQAATQLDDPALIDRIERLYRDNGRSAVLEKGKELVRWFNDAKPVKPRKEVELFVRMTNFLLEGSFTVSLVSFEPRKLGKVNQYIATLNVVRS